MENQVTILIKTFERKNALARLLRSIEQHYPKIRIVVVDDSKRSYKKVILKKFPQLNLDYVVADYDIGLSAGRNLLLKHAHTKYILLCDDDFEFDERTKIQELIKLKQQNRLDIIGGCVYNRISLNGIYSILWAAKKPERIKKMLKREEFVSVYNGKYLVKNGDVLLKADRDPQHFQVAKVYDTEICNNFFLADTKTLQKIGGWTPAELKVGEHEIFFLKVKNAKLKVGYTPRVGVRHYPKKSIGYFKYRARAEKMFQAACRKDQNVRSFKILDVQRNQYIYTFEREGGEHD